MNDDASDMRLIEDLMADYGITPDDTLADLIEAIEEEEGDHAEETI